MDYEELHRFYYGDTSFRTIHHNKSPLRMIISLSYAGDMKPNYKRVQNNRRKLFRKLNIEGRVVSLKQIHSKSVFTFRDFPENNNFPGKMEQKEGDGLITDNTQLIPAITVADCLPIALYSKKKKIFGIVHSGWKGTGIILRALEVFRKAYNVDPSEVEIIIGPGIGPCCYDVKQERAEFFLEQYGKHSIHTRQGKSFIDLKQVNIDLVKKQGVASIHDRHQCTACHPQYGSFRRQGKDDFVHMIAMIGFF